MKDLDPNDVIAKPAGHVAAIVAELDRVRLERDRLAQWVYHPEGPAADDVVDLMADGPAPVAALAVALAEHDRKAKEKP